MLLSDWVFGDANFTGFLSPVVSEKTADGTKKEIAGRILVSKVICPKEQLE